MKKFGKILSFLLTAATFCSVLTNPVSAADSAEFSETGMYESATYQFSVEDGAPASDYIAITHEKARSGNYALYVHHRMISETPEGETVDRKPMYVTMKNDSNITLQSGTEYAIEFYFKGELDWFSVGHMFEYEDKYRFTYSYNKEYKVEDVNGWEKVQIKFTPSDTFKFNSRLLCCDAGADFVIDDFAIYETANPSVNLLPDGGFENSYPVIGNIVYDEEGLSTNNFTTQYGDGVSTDANFAKITRKYARTGNYALFVHREDTSGNFFRVRFNQDAIKVDEGKTFFIEYWLNGKIGSQDFITHRNWADDDMYASDANYVETDSNGWKLYRKKYVAGSGNALAGILFDVCTTCNVVIDDFRVYTEDNPNVNLLTDGGFENSEMEDLTTPINLMAAPTWSSDKVVVSWTNPSNTHIEAYKLYIDENLISDFVANTSALGFNQYIFDGLDPFVKYNVKLVETINGEDYEYTIAAMSENYGQYSPCIGNYPAGNWSVDRREVNGNYANFVVAADSENKSSGKSSLRINCNKPNRESDMLSNVKQVVTLDCNKKYRLKFKYKSAGTKIAQVYESATDIWEAHWFIWDTAAPKGHVCDWTEKVIDLSTTKYDPLSSEQYEETLMFAVEQSIGSLWLDDIELKEIDEYDETQTIGDNLISNGGFEFEPYTIDKPKFAQNGEVIDEIKSGEIEVTAAVKNISAGDDFKVTVFVALYDGDKLLDVNLMQRTLTEKPYQLPADEFTSKINVPDKVGNYSISIMYWNGIDTMVPLKNKDVL